MQVSQIAELDSHAVIGGGKARAFSMSDSAEFFTVLSDTLYGDKKRAVIREVICNAWDAHLMVGATTRPVQVTLTDEELIIKDFGPGIDDEFIEPIYCVYGASTKVKDENQTGGFGLGSKAPFAYSDHFTVVSCYAGFRTVYAISRGGAATKGKPDIRPMVRVPTTESGITVSIPLRQATDRKDFEAIIKAVAFQGGMLVELNGKQLDTLDYTEARKTGFCLIPQASSHNLNLTKVYLLYGTVLYPISTTDEEIMTKASELDGLVENHGKIILVAPPSSIGVMPSREGLSYSELTNKTVLDLMASAKKKIQFFLPIVAKDVIKARVKKMKRYELTNSLVGMSSPNKGLVCDPREIAFRAGNESLNFISSQKRDGMILNAVAKRFRDDRRVFRRAAGKVDPNDRFLHRFDFEREAFRNSSRLFVRLASKLNLLDRLHAVSESFGHSGRLRSLDDFQSYGEAVPVLYISPTQRDAMKVIKVKIEANRGKNAYLATPNVHMAMIIHRPTDELIGQIEAIAKTYKIEVVKLAYTPPKKKAPSAGLFYDFSKMSADKKKIAEIPTLDSASIYIRTSGSCDKLQNQAEFHVKKELLELYPVIALATNAREEAKLRAKGAKSVLETVVAEASKLTDSREVQYAYLAKRGLFVTGGSYGYNSVSSCAQTLAQLDISLAKMLFPDKIKIGEKSARARKLIDVLGSIGGHSNNGYDQRIKVDRDLDRKAKESFGHLIITHAVATERFAYLKTLRGGVHYHDSTDVAALRDVIRFLKRRESKSILTDKSLKEAA